MNEKDIDISKIELIIYDFDGVMTDNRALIFSDGTEAVFINRGDGLAISKFKELGIEQMIVSTEKNIIVKKRANKLDIPIYQGINNKLACIKKIITDNSFSKQKVIYIGNDINDMEVMSYIGWPIAPADACEKVKAIAKIVTKAVGGRGVIRELLDIITAEVLANDHDF